MDKTKKFILPTPNFEKKLAEPPKKQPHFLTPSGMTLLPRTHQPPPMYGPKGSTVPPKFLPQHKSVPPKNVTNERQFCEPCEMEFHSKDDLYRHRGQHEPCPVDGCRFKGHALMMDKHVTELHASGVFDKIKKLSTPEEIAAWREERRKKYPTLANAQMRQLAKEQRQKRGERLEEKKARFGCNVDRKRARNIEKPETVSNNQNLNITKHNKWKTRKQADKNSKAKVTETPESKPNEQKNDEETFSCGIIMFKGTSKMEDYDHVKPKKPRKQNVLSGLLGMYGSDDDETDDNDSENSVEPFEPIVCETDVSPENKLDVCSDNARSTVNQKEIINEHSTDEMPAEVLIESNEPLQNSVNPNSSTSVERIDEVPEIKSVQADTDNNIQLSSDEGPEEIPIERTSAMPDNLKTKTEDYPGTASTLDEDPSKFKRCKTDNRIARIKEKRKYGLQYRKTRLRKQNTMLEKLLEPEIRHERNVLLQCVRFVCENNFFGIEVKKSAQESLTHLS